MSYFVKNVTDTSSVPMILSVNDIPNVFWIKWMPGEIKDLELIATNDQILQSRHLKVHILEGRMVKV